jgi:hypothetical protein
MKKLTYRQIAEGMRVNIHKARRFGKVVLEVDPEAGAGSGVTREFDETEAFILMFAKLLMDDFGFSLKEAGKHALQIVSEIDKRGLWPEGARQGDIANFDVMIQPDGIYALRLFEAGISGNRGIKRIDWEAQSISYDQQFTDFIFPKGAGIDLTGPVYTVMLSEVLKNFIGWAERL